MRSYTSPGFKTKLQIALSRANHPVELSELSAPGIVGMKVVLNKVKKDEN